MSTTGTCTGTGEICQRDSILSTLTWKVNAYHLLLFQEAWETSSSPRHKEFAWCSHISIL